MSPYGQHVPGYAYKNNTTRHALQTEQIFFCNKVKISCVIANIRNGLEVLVANEELVEEEPQKNSARLDGQ